VAVINPLATKLPNAANTERAREILHEIVDDMDRIRRKDPKSHEFVSSIIERVYASRGDPYVSDKQIEWLESLLERREHGYSNTGRH